MNGALMGQMNGLQVVVDMCYIMLAKISFNFISPHIKIELLLRGMWYVHDIRIIR